MVTDGYGDRVPDWTQTPDSLPIPGCVIAPGASAEILTGRDAVETVWTLYKDAAVDVTALDAVDLDGTRYQVNGTPAVFHHPTRGTNRTVIELRRWEG